MSNVSCVLNVSGRPARKGVVCADLRFRLSGREKRLCLFTGAKLTKISETLHFPGERGPGKYRGRVVTTRPRLPLT